MPATFATSTQIIHARSSKTNRVQSMGRVARYSEQPTILSVSEQQKFRRLGNFLQKPFRRL